MFVPPFPHFLMFLDLAFILALEGTPVFVVALSAARASEKRFCQIVFAAGGLISLHCVLIVTWLYLLMRDPWFLDPNPVDSLTLKTLNSSIPLALSGIVIAICLRPVLIRQTSFRAGLLLLVIASGCFVGYSHYFFDGLLGTPLTEVVWWL